MDTLIGAIVSIKDLLQGEKEEEICYIRNAKGGDPDKYMFKKDRIYNIPGYQREIRWSANNVQVLVDDLIDGNRFLGYILMSTEDKTKYNIIDGQQRLTVIFMLLDAMKKRDSKKSFETCGLNNESFGDIKEAICYNFYQEEAEKQKKCKSEDILNQYDKMVELSNYINKVVDEMAEDKFGKLQENLYDSDVNLIIQPIRSKNDEKRACVDYFIDINNKNVRLDYIDILKAYAFKDNFESIIDKWVLIPKKIKELKVDFYYPIEDMYLHYILCTVNEECKFGIKGINDELKLSKSIEIDGITYEAGIDVEVLIKRRDFYLNMLDRICSFIDFVKVVVNDKNTYGEDFAKYIKPKDGTINDESKQNYFDIINGIMRSSDVVPKLLLMKYYIYVILNDEANKSDYDIIYDIGIITTIFTAGPGDNKNRNVFSNIVLKKAWQTSIKNKSRDSVIKWKNKIIFNKIIKDNGRYTESSGQFVARRVHALIYSTSFNDDAKIIKIKKDAFYRFNMTTDYNDEHFLINQSYGIDFMFKKHLEKYSYPERIKPLISHLGNYLIIDKKVNQKLGNKTIKDKICMIEDFLLKGKKVFGDELSKVIYNVAKEVFGSDESSCPVEKDLRKSNSVEDAKELLDKYFNDDFGTEYIKFCELLKERINELDLHDLNFNQV